MNSTFLLSGNDTNISILSRESSDNVYLMVNLWDVSRLVCVRWKRVVVGAEVSVNSGKRPKVGPVRRYCHVTYTSLI